MTLPACLLGPNSGWLNIHTLPSQLPDRLSSDDPASYFHGHALETCSFLVTGPLFSLGAKHVLSKHPLLVSVLILRPYHHPVPSLCPDLSHSA